MKRGTVRDCCSSLPHIVCKALNRPGCQTQSLDRSTPRPSPISRHPTMTKPHANSDSPIFIPARSRVVRWAETLLIFSPAFAGVSAVFFAILKNSGAAQ
ncbi:hypothetical protein FHR76_002160 [Rhizobium sp. RAS22]|nr:hypothetical protein [Rhizobium sp. RAS22]